MGVHWLEAPRESLKSFSMRWEFCFFSFITSPKIPKVTREIIRNLDLANLLLSFQAFYIYPRLTSPFYIIEDYSK